ncbi:MAG: hypothetical protein L0Y44_01140 [Phycisphaerales bacterium]|nr:hypothetical protein [Phycisphaerales bacterium]MCI0629243.1 hypothetical protein [Phycisphaerales bacterium]MCI0675876.1 hypothetical protein [Phycisphaerales bacterium]
MTAHTTPPLVTIVEVAKLMTPFDRVLPVVGHPVRMDHHDILIDRAKGAEAQQ